MTGSNVISKVLLSWFRITFYNNYIRWSRKGVFTTEGRKLFR